MLNTALGYARNHQELFLERLCDWLRIPSISTLPEHAGEVRRAGLWVMNLLSELGFERVEMVETRGHPLIYAEWLGLAAPTLLVYGHFDVQPVDPLDAWLQPPFEPIVKGQDLYGRGAVDDKGQLYTILAALEACIMTDGGPPLNLKVLLEGEEEVTSPNLPVYLRQHAEELKADAVLICDQEMLDPSTPVILYGVRGILYVEASVSGPARDLHSGTFGGAVDNPFNVLVRLLAGLQDGLTRKVLIPGFYEGVRPLDDEERALIARAPITDEIGLYLTGAPALAGEAGFSLAERIGARPTLEIHGISGGFTGEGAKTVIPASVSAKLSMRLVPDQQPDEIAQALEAYLLSQVPSTVALELRVLGAARPALIDRRALAVQAAARAYERAFGSAPVYLRGGGSLPIVSDMIEALSPTGGGEKIPVVMMGFGLPDGNTHAPNEKLHLPCFYSGIEAVLHFLYEYSRGDDFRRR